MKGRGTQMINNYILAYNGKKDNERSVAGVRIFSLKIPKFHRGIDYVDERFPVIRLKRSNSYTHSITNMLLMWPSHDSKELAFYEELQKVLHDKVPQDKIHYIKIAGDLSVQIGDDQIG